MILIDTDIMIDLLRQYEPAIEWIESLDGCERILLPGYVVMELIQGCRDKGEQSKLRRAISNLGVIWPAPEECDLAVVTFDKYRLSYNIGLLDVLIAHTAMEYGLPLYTFNQKHYSAIKKLKTVQPYGKS